MSERTELIDKVEEKTGWHVNRRRFKIVTDTSQWMEINKGDVIRIEDYEFAIRGNMREPRFGIDDQPKYWVFHAIDLGTGEQKILKTVYHEEFYAHIGILKVRCYRSQSKESQVLDITRGDRRFMQGFTCYDEKGNNVRILDYIKGKSFFHFIPDIEKSHEEYFHEDLPRILWKLTDSILAVQFLHVSGMCHGDIRNDHIIIESGTKDYRWIDFDLKQDVRDFDLWSIGNILSYTVGKGI
ncbi:MAG: serine/threonine protein kinase, partial [Bacteroidota bacterium]